MILATKQRMKDASGQKELSALANGWDVYPNQMCVPMILIRSSVFLGKELL